MPMHMHEMPKHERD